MRLWFWEPLGVKVLSFAHASDVWPVVFRCAVCCLWKATQKLLRNRKEPFGAGFALTATQWGRWRVAVKDQGLESPAKLGGLVSPLPAV